MRRAVRHTQRLPHLSCTRRRPRPRSRCPRPRRGRSRRRCRCPRRSPPRHRCPLSCQSSPPRSARRPSAAVAAPPALRAKRAASADVRRSEAARAGRPDSRNSTTFKLPLAAARDARAQRGAAQRAHLRASCARVACALASAPPPACLSALLSIRSHCARRQRRRGQLVGTAARQHARTRSPHLEPTCYSSCVLSCRSYKSASADAADYAAASR